ncbi:MAG: pseudouridine synthase [Candidatus Omnitrophota bacterium]
MSGMRLQVALAKAGVASRRRAARIIESGCVKVNGRIVNKKGFRVNIARDRITVDGKKLAFEKKKYYYILNKPSGVLSTARDERGRKKVSDYVTAEGVRLYPVGRLDKDTTGVIILTNDGDLTYRLTHPKFGVERVYEVKASGSVGKEGALCLKKGVIIDGGLAQAEKIIFKRKTPKFTVLLLSIREGRKREVRRMLEATGHKVLELKRIAYGPLGLGGLKEGRARHLKKDELIKLKKCVGLA